MDETTEEMLLTPRTELARLARLLPSITEERVAIRLLQTKIAEGKAQPTRAAEKRLKDLERVERFQASRPEGCFCLGAGSLEGKWCACPDGVAGLAAQEEREREWHAADKRHWIEAAGIPPRFTDCTWATHPGKAEFVNLLEKMAGEKSYSPFLWGSYGTGKTGLACGLLRERVEREHESALFVTVPNLLEMIRATYDKDARESERSRLSQMRTSPFLVLDDLGAEKPTDWVQEQLYLILNHRHDHMLDTCITSNLNLNQLAERIGERTTWRIAEMCTVIHVEGPNLRDKR